MGDEKKSSGLVMTVAELKRARKAALYIEQNLALALEGATLGTDGEVIDVESIAGDLQGDLAILRDCLRAVAS
jgi:hypothetical protein